MMCCLNYTIFIKMIHFRYAIWRGLFQFPIRGLVLRSRKISKLQDMYLELYIHSRWHLTGALSALLSIWLLDLKAVRWFELPISRRQNLTKSFKGILKRSLGSMFNTTASEFLINYAKRRNEGRLVGDAVMLIGFCNSKMIWNMILNGLIH